MRRHAILFMLPALCFAQGCARETPRGLLMELARNQQEGHTAIGYVYDRELHLISLHPQPSMQTATVPEPGFYSVAISPSGNYYGVSRKNENLFVALRRDGAVIWSRSGLFAEEIPEISPTEDSLAFKGRDTTTGKAGLLLVEKEGSTVTLLSLAAKNPSWSNDGSQLVYEENNVVRIYSRETRQSREIAKGTKPRWSPDGMSISMQRQDGRFCILDPEGKIKKELFDGRDITTPVYWAPNSQYVMFFRKGGFLDGIACSDESEDLMILRLRDGESGRLMKFCNSYPYQDFRWLRVTNAISIAEGKAD